MDIIDPRTNQSYNIFSASGLQLLRQYIMAYTYTGGATPSIAIIKEINLFPEDSIE